MICKVLIAFADFKNSHRLPRTHVYLYIGIYAYKKGMHFYLLLMILSVYT